METDVAIIGGGVLGVTTAYWLSELYECRITVVEKESQVARQTTLRNTGVIHRPYYLNPSKRRVFALSAGKSFPMWKELAKRFGLPLRECGTMMLAIEDGQLDDLENYERWAAENGMSDEEYSRLDREETRRLEPEVECRGAFLSRTDTSTDFAELTRAVWNVAASNGAKLLPSAKVEKVETRAEGLEIALHDGRSLECSLMINVAGGSSLGIAHMAGLAWEYADLHFRGEYWVVGESVSPRVTRNIYSVARHAEFNFLDPHFIVKANGGREVGPNAVLVAGPDTYVGAGGPVQLLAKIVERPLSPKVRLFRNPTFLSLALDEWKSSLSKAAMCQRVRAFIPALEPSMLVQRGLAGVRSSLRGMEGFVPEAVIVEGGRSLHVLNFNSPGATGAPVFSAHVVRVLKEKGLLREPSREGRKSQLWDFENTQLP